ncbi:hypothetical protein HO932_05430 [Streptococcus suis]|nr:hypothetical protein [Streptococcus suis]NQN95540.1 hypothetical protein [Streptococcus suis]NQO33040.1 hypothetical protein [Streptococcus suis]NQO43420.1 hypothetical protein [Streptococcus suis]NQO53964.1 hypothetical protein [Streptococcus suis]
MPEYYTTEEFTKPIECLTMALEDIQCLYDEKRIEDRENAEQLIDSYKYAIELLKKAEVE